MQQVRIGAVVAQLVGIYVIGISLGVIARSGRKRREGSKNVGGYAGIALDVRQSHRIVRQDVHGDLGVRQQLQVPRHAAVAEEHESPRRREQRRHSAFGHG